MKSSNSVAFGESESPATPATPSNAQKKWKAVSRRALFIQQQQLLKNVINSTPSSHFPPAVTSPNDSVFGNQTIDYDEAWEAVKFAIDPPSSFKTSESVSDGQTRTEATSIRESELRTKEKKHEIMERHQQQRTAAMFAQQLSGDKKAPKLMQQSMESGKKTKYRRSASICGSTMHQRGNKDSCQEVSSNFATGGVNWVCPHNPVNGGLNGSCMRPTTHSPLIDLDSPHCFNLQASEVVTYTSIVRNVYVDKKGCEHDEKRVYFRSLPEVSSSDAFKSRSSSSTENSMEVPSRNLSKLKNASTSVNNSFDMDPVCNREGGVVSPWHDVSVICLEPPPHIKKAAGILCNMIVEIPRFNSAKMEIATNRTHNPIIQDRTKDGKLRHYPGPIMWNYGAFPQTWEDPCHEGDEEVHFAFGDGDPLDVLDVARNQPREFAIGEVVPVRVLGVLPMLDGGGQELDWKVIAINVYDENFESIHDLASLEAFYPHTLTGAREWFRWYKYNSPTGSLNDFGHMGLVLCRCGAEDVLMGAYEQWAKLQEKCFEKVQLSLNSSTTPLKDRKLHLTKDFADDIWHPMHLRKGTKAFEDRHKVTTLSTLRSSPTRNMLMLN